MSLLCWQHWPQSHSIRPPQQSHTHTHKKCTHPGPQAGSRTIFILAYKAGQQSSVSVLCMFICVCILAVVPVVQECGCALSGVLQQIGKGHLADRKSIKVRTVSICYIQNRDGVSGAIVNLLPSSSAWWIESKVRRYRWRGCIAIYRRVIDVSLPPTQKHWDHVSSHASLQD